MAVAHSYCCELLMAYTVPNPRGAAPRLKGCLSRTARNCHDMCYIARVGCMHIAKQQQLMCPVKVTGSSRGGCGQTISSTLFFSHRK